MLDKSVNAVQTVVKDEIQNYSTVLENAATAVKESCVSALAPSGQQNPFSNFGWARKKHCELLHAISDLVHQNTRIVSGSGVFHKVLYFGTGKLIEIYRIRPVTTSYDDKKF
eukprot:sb/3477034/